MANVTTTTTAIAELVHQIKELLSAMKAQSGTLVLNKVETGRLLSRLRAKANGNWNRMLQEIGMNDRVARRYMALVKNGWWTTGLKESGLHEILPPDVMKLEWLCRLTREQLEGVKDWPFKHWTREQLIEALKRRFWPGCRLKSQQAENESTDPDIRDETDAELVLSAVNQFFAGPISALTFRLENGNVAVLRKIRGDVGTIRFAQHAAERSVA